jgi:hypothetical protein
MHRYMHAQKKKIEIEKWCEGIRLNKDPGNEFVLEWILSHANWFRKSWEKSLCRKCLLAEQCGHNVAEQCEKYADN